LGKSTRSEEPHVKRVFGFAVTATFAAELAALLLIIGSIASFVVSHSGLLQALSMDIQLFLLLIATGIAFLILILFAGLFIKWDDKLKDKILTARIERLTRVTSEAKALLGLFGLALIFLCSAGIYGYYLLWNYVLQYFVGGSLSLTVLFIGVGMVLVSILAQLVIALVGRFASRTVK
jgi:MFS family permease